MTAPRRNVEIKAKLESLEEARTIARRLATDYVGLQRQRDTYFHCQSGRLKLRQIEGRPAQLIAYRRADQTAPKGSDYHLVPVEDPAGVKAALSAALGVRGVVCKQREIFLCENVRIHLDQVKGLGVFLELEAVVSRSGGKTGDETADRRRIEQLLGEFGILPSALLPASYAEMAGPGGG